MKNIVYLLLAFPLVTSSCEDAPQPGRVPPPQVVAQANSVATSTPIPTPADPLARAEQLVQKADALWKHGDKRGSLAAAEEALAIFEEKLGKKAERTVQVRVMVAQAQMAIMMP